jgi:hypothetical protein
MGGDGLVAIHSAGSGRSWRVGRASSFGCVILADRQLAVAARHARAGTRWSSTDRSPDPRVVRILG